MIVLWAVFILQPLENQPFVQDIAKAEAKARPAGFDEMMEQAMGERSPRKRRSTSPVALRQIAKERKIDLAQFFRGCPAAESNASSLKNIEKRNDILLNELLTRSPRAACKRASIWRAASRSHSKWIRAVRRRQVGMGRARRN